MTTVADRLVRHLQIMHSGDISLSTTHRLIALVRELIEERNLRKQYPLLTMFCDWSLHSRLDRSPAGVELLDLLDETWANSRQVDEQLKRLVSQLSPNTLRADLVSLLRSALIWPGPLEDDNMFRSIISEFTADIAHKPICRNAKEQAKRIQARLASGYRFAAERIQFEKLEGQLQLVLVATQIEPASGGKVRIQIPWDF